MHGPLPRLNDPEGKRVPTSLPCIVDAHVHLFPDKLFTAIRSWLDKFAWDVRYRLKSPEVIEFLLARGVDYIVGLHYAHKPGMAPMLNRYMAGLCRDYPQVIGTGAVFPGEDGAAAILEEAFELGLTGVKLHAHVQFFSPDGDEMHEIYELCLRHGQPLVMHVGRDPKSSVYHYRRDPYRICGADKLEPVLKRYPGLRVCVPHLGADEFDAHQHLIEKYDNLWLDTAVALADYPSFRNRPHPTQMRADRIMYGTDFPQIAYAWDRELKRLCQLDIPQESLELIMGRNALDFFSVSGAA